MAPEQNLAVERFCISLKNLEEEYKKDASVFERLREKIQESMSSHGSTTKTYVLLAAKDHILHVTRK